MADTRKEKLQDLLDAMEASKSKLAREELLEILKKKQEAPKQSIIPQDMRNEPKYETLPATQATPAKPVPLPFEVKDKDKDKMRLYRMMR